MQTPEQIASAIMESPRWDASGNWRNIQAAIMEGIETDRAQRDGAEVLEKIRRYAADRAAHSHHPILNTVGSGRVASDLFHMLGMPCPLGIAEKFDRNATRANYDTTHTSRPDAQPMWDDLSAEEQLAILQDAWDDLNDEARDAERQLASASEFARVRGFDLVWCHGCGHDIEPTPDGQCPHDTQHPIGREPYTKIGE